MYSSFKPLILVALIAMLSTAALASTEDPGFLRPFGTTVQHQYSPEAQKYFDLGMKAFVHLDYPVAKEYLNLALQHAGFDLAFARDCHYYLGVVSSWKRAFDVAEWHFRAVLKIDSNIPIFWFYFFDNEIHPILPYEVTRTIESMKSSPLLKEYYGARISMGAGFSYSMMKKNQRVQEDLDLVKDYYTSAIEGFDLVLADSNFIYRYDADIFRRLCVNELQKERTRLE